eukprot:2553989-Ditylum_brightwellii.AAC.1
MTEKKRNTGKSLIENPALHDTHKTENHDNMPCIPTVNHPRKAPIHETKINIYCINSSFTTTENKELCPRLKCATLLATIVQQFPVTVSNEWKEEGKARVITAGEDLPYKKETLE